MFVAALSHDENEEARERGSSAARSPHRFAARERAVGESEASEQLLLLSDSIELQAASA